MFFNDYYLCWCECGGCCGWQENMKVMRDEWNQMDASQRQPYERAAAMDLNRYLRQVHPVARLQAGQTEGFELPHLPSGPLVEFAHD